MHTAGAPRRKVLVELVPPDVQPVIDVGADHGHVAHALDAIATERMPHRAGRTDNRWVIADGLKPFRRVGVAVIAGMGWRTIARILAEGPAVDWLVLHAQDDPPALREWLASNGYRIDAERLAPEAGRFAEVIRATKGTEVARDLDLFFGPKLTQGGDPLWAPHFQQLHGYYSGLADKTRGASEGAYRRFAQRRDYLEALLERGPRTT